MDFFRAFKNFLTNTKNIHWIICVDVCKFIASTAPKVYDFFVGGILDLFVAIVYCFFFVIITLIGYCFFYGLLFPLLLLLLQLFFFLLFLPSQMCGKRAPRLVN